MLNQEYPKFEKSSFEGIEISLSEPNVKINLRGKKKEFFTKIGKILSIILPIEPNTSSSNQQYNTLWLSPDEWLIIAKELASKDTNKSDLYEMLFNSISKTNLGAVIDVTDQFVQLELKGENVYEIFSAGSPFNFNEFKEKKGSTTQTVLNHVDVILHHKDENILNLFVRRSFAEHLWSWIEDCASRL